MLGAAHIKHSVDFFTFGNPTVFTSPPVKIVRHANHTSTLDDVLYRIHHQILGVVLNDMPVYSMTWAVNGSSSVFFFLESLPQMVTVAHCLALPISHT